MPPHILANIVACTLDVAHFIKLVPLEQRPKGQSTAGLAAGIPLDIATMKHTVLNENTFTSENVFPDLQTLLNALSTYLVIRDLYDVDNVGFGSAIGLYIRQLACWSKRHNWPAIISYFVAHFRKHQSSNDPSDWYNVDIQLFTAHMTNDTLAKSVTSKDHTCDQSSPGMMWTKVVFGKNVLANTFVLNVLEIIQNSNVQGYPSQVDIQFTHSQFLVQPKCGVESRHSRSVLPSETNLYSLQFPSANAVYQNSR